MKKVTIVGIITIFAVILFGVSSFANNNIASDAVNGVRNVVGGAENVIEGAAAGITNGVRNGMSAVGNTMQNAGNTMQGAMTNDNRDNDNYDATRTATTRTIAATDNTTNTIFGMGPRAWSWFTLATLGIITVALVWYYGQQKEVRYNNNEDNY